MPRAVVHAPQALGGLGIQQLSVEQGIAHILFLIGSIRAQTAEAPLVMTLLESYIVTSGIIGNPLINMMPVPYIDARWIECTRIFLNAVQATIQLPTLPTIQPLRHRDKGLMEMAQIHFDKLDDLTMINNCRLYLRVHTLAEITSLDGTTILPEALSGADARETNTPLLWNHSTSKLNWPHQPRPPPKAWNKWRRLLLIYTKKSELTLRRPLGAFLLHSLEIHRTWPEQPTFHPTTATPPPPLVSHYALVTWTLRTFYQLTSATHINVLIQTTSLYEETAFRWTLAHGNNVIIEKQSKCPPNLYAAKNQSTILALIDALSTIQNEHRRRYAPRPNTRITVWLPCQKTIRLCTQYQHQFHTATTATREESELYQSACALIQNTPNCRLKKIPRQCPEHLKTQLQETAIHKGDLPTIHTTCHLPSPRATLTLNNHIITANAAEHLRTAYASQNYREYIQKKYDWSDHTTDDIDWNLFSHTIAKLSHSNKRILQKFLHNWLPTNGHKGRKLDCTTTKCLLGCDEDETNHHFLHCPKDQLLWTETFTKILDKHTKHIPEFGSLFKSGLTTPPASMATNGPADDLPITFYPLYRSQQAIGWDHLIYGHWSHSWIAHYDSNIRNEDTGLQWASALLLELWKAIIQKWTRRCKNAHLATPSTKDTATTAAHAQIDTMYESFDKLDSVDKKLLARPIDVLKKLPLRQKQAWIRRTQPHLQDGLRRAKIRQTLNTRPLTHYFAPRNNPPPRPPQNLPIQSPRARQHDFDPP